MGQNAERNTAHNTAQSIADNTLQNTVQNTERDMAGGSLVKTLASFTIHLIFSSLFQQIFNWVDAFIVGNVEGEAALAGIGAAGSIYNLFVTVIVGFTSGISVMAAQKYGKGERVALRRILSSFVMLLGALCFAAAGLGMLFTGPALHL